MLSHPCNRNAFTMTFLILLFTGCASSPPEDELIYNSQGKIDLKESMKGRREIVVPIEQLDKLDPDQLKGKKLEIIYENAPRSRSKEKAKFEKGGLKIEVLDAPSEQNLKDITITPDEPSTSSPPTKKQDALALEHLLPLWKTVFILPHLNWGQFVSRF